MKRELKLLWLKDEMTRLNGLMLNEDEKINFYFGEDKEIYDRAIVNKNMLSSRLLACKLVKEKIHDNVPRHKFYEILLSNVRNNTEMVNAENILKVLDKIA